MCVFGFVGEEVGGLDCVFLWWEGFGSFGIWRVGVWDFWVGVLKLGGVGELGFLGFEGRVCLDFDVLVKFFF